MARAIWPRRWTVNRSVLRRSWPKFESQELARSTGQRMPKECGFFVFLGFLGSQGLRLLAQMTSVSPTAWQRSMVRVLS